MSTSPQPGLYVNGDRVRNAVTPAQAVQAVWDGFVPAPDEVAPTENASTQTPEAPKAEAPKPKAPKTPRS